MANNTPPLPIKPASNHNQNQNRNQSQGQNQSKGNFWLIVIIILVVIAVLWPILRRPSSTDTFLDESEEVATTIVPVDEAIDTVSIDNPVEPNQEVIKPLAAIATALPEIQTLRIYFGNQKFDPSGQKCETVYPVFRTVPRTTAVARAALTELLKGPTATEAANGATTSLKPEVKLQNLTIANTIARADFSREFELGAADGCQAAAQRAQITETLKQFPTVKSVVISVNQNIY